MANKQKFSSKRMFEEINRRDNLVISGLVKPHDRDDGTVLVARVESPTDWIPVTEDLIANYEFIGRVRSGGVVYPYVSLYISEPKTDKEQIFARATVVDVLSDELLTRASFSSPASNVDGATHGINHPGGGTDCQYDRLRRGWFVPGTNTRCIPS